MNLKGIRRFFSSGKGSDPRKLQFRADDVFIVSYPKSGNTWLRFLIGNYLTGGMIDFKNSHKVVPDVHFNPSEIDQLEFRPRFIKSHETFNAQYRNVVYVVRDGRDVAVSYFYYLKKTGYLSQDLPFDRFLESHFLLGKLPFGDWAHHVRSWLGAKDTNVTVVKYEDLLRDTYNQVCRIFLALRFENIDHDRISAAVGRSSFERMKNDESNNPQYFLETFGLKETGYGFMRKGEVGDWKNHFSSDDLVSFFEKYGDLMKSLDY